LIVLIDFAGYTVKKVEGQPPPNGLCIPSPSRTQSTGTPTEQQNTCPQIDIDAIHKALANAVRREILAWPREPEVHFAEQELPLDHGVCAGQIDARCNLSQSTESVHLAALGAPHGSGLGKTRWPVERSIAWLHSFRRLKVRYERYAHVHEAFMSLACALICWTRLKPLFN
jgi:hypothetical protein